MADGNTDNLLAAVKQLSSRIETLTAQQRDWKIALRNGVLAGLGGVLGATLVVSALIYFLQPFKSIEAFGPMIERLDSTLKKTAK